MAEAWHDHYILVNESKDGGAEVSGMLGELEQIVLFALVRLGGEAHGAPIVDEIATQLDRHVSPGALYTVLDRLGGKSYVESWIGDSTPERGGRRRRVYRITPEGAAALRVWYQGIQDMAVGTGPRIDRLAEQER